MFRGRVGISPLVHVGCEPGASWMIESPGDNRIEDSGVILVALDRGCPVDE